MITTESIQFTGPYKLEFVSKRLPDLLPHQILVKTLACGICQREIQVYNGYENNRYPDIMGHEPVGIVQKIGEKVQNVSVGDIVSTMGDHCLSRYYIADDEFSHKVVNGNNEDILGFLGEPVMCAVNALRWSGLQPGSNVVVVGCGFMGTLLIQGLSHSLTNNIIVLDINGNAKMRALTNGADYFFTVNDSIQEYISKTFGKENIDLVFEASGSLSGLEIATRLVRHGGTICMYGHQTTNKFFSFDQWHFKGLRILNTVPWISNNLSREFRDGVNLLNKGYFNTSSLISHYFEFSDAKIAFEVANNHPENYVKGVICFSGGCV
ncbi:zinc-dependent alcohol dehydrogenase [Rummeliibacillus suwonensis]|uniref:zinc-dependent alcohol dehydrogenase n=1 Tax=Rummeliibacillus suwonensis TaxID=1306154 RepID=UPI001AAF5C7E|nr:zinc-binding dehydrogenase [Rummeliibacillus suwonensis]MBO2535622.1 zinc-binding dehydrogenase [Rummeliibacillus suwonensis]